MKETDMKKLGFGFMRLPLLDKEDTASFDYEQITQMVDTFMERGFIYFDTAYFYHKNQSERVIKKVLVDRYPRDRFLLATKLPMGCVEKEEDVLRLFNEQLEKTGTTYFDYYLMHAMNKERFELAKKLGVLDKLLALKKEGKIKRIGFSFHDTAEVLEEMLKGFPEIEFVQLQMNYLDWESPKVQSRECYELALKYGKEVIVMEPVKGGALAKVPFKAEKLFKERNADASIPSWAVRFVAGLDNVIMVLSGMSSMEQLMDNTDYMQSFVPLTEEEKALCFEVAEIIENYTAISCTDCKYCVEECPKKIAIPDYFALYNKAVEGEGEGFEKAKEEYKSLVLKAGKPTDCIECGKCQTQCPQRIKIIDCLKKVSKKFS